MKTKESKKKLSKEEIKEAIEEHRRGKWEPQQKENNE